MPQNYLKLGDWNSICDVCGLKFKATELKKDWRGLMVCSEDYELRHPQDFLRVRGDNPSVPWTRPEGEDVFIGPACMLWDQSAYADMGTADCMRADYTPLPFLALLALKYPSLTTPPFGLAIPDLAIPQLAIPDTST